MAKSIPAIAMDITQPRSLVNEDLPDFGRVVIDPYCGQTNTKAMLDDLTLLFLNRAEFVTSTFIEERFQPMSPNAVRRILSQDFRTTQWQKHLTLASITLKPEYGHLLNDYARDQIKIHAPLRGYVILERLGMELAVQLGVPAYEFYRKLIYSSEQRILSLYKGLGKLGDLAVMWLDHFMNGTEFDPILASNQAEYLALYLPEGYSLWVVDPQGFIRKALSELMHFERCRTIQERQELQFLFQERRSVFTQREFMERFRISANKTFQDHMSRLTLTLRRCGLHLGKLRDRHGNWYYKIGELAPNPREAFVDMVVMTQDVQKNLGERYKPALMTRESVVELISELSKNPVLAGLAMRLNGVITSFERERGILNLERLQFLLQQPEVKVSRPARKRDSEPKLPAPKK